MTEGLRGHLFASLLAVNDLIHKMERAGREGRSPASGQALTPLSAEEWQTLSEILERIRAQMLDAVRHFNEACLVRHNTPRSRADTLFWLSTLLRQMEEEIMEDLAPARVERRYGALEEAERKALSELVEALHRETDALRARLDAARLQIP
jgi:superfamily II DNA/RNA helicase